MTLETQVRGSLGFILTSACIGCGNDSLKIFIVSRNYCVLKLSLTGRQKETYPRLLSSIQGVSADKKVTMFKFTGGINKQPCLHFPLCIV